MKSWTLGPYLTISNWLMTLRGRKSPSLQTNWNATALDSLCFTSEKLMKQKEVISETHGTSLSDFHAGLVKPWCREGDCISIFILITEKFSFIIHRYIDCLGCLINKEVFFFFLPLCDHRKEKPLQCQCIRINCYQNRSWCPLITVLSNRHL